MAVGLQTKRETPQATPPSAAPPVAAPDEFERDFQKFKELSDRAARRMPLKWEDRRPCLGERTEGCAFDRHYVYHTAWAARVLAILKPKLHVDVSSSLYFSAIASAFVPVDYYEYRPVKLTLDNFRSRTADLLALPFRDQSVPSISCMHAVEHVGLGRYGDPLDAEGDLKAMAELQRVVAPGGSLIFVAPVGKPRVVEEQVLTVDMAPSILELCGAPPLEKVHGKSWVPLARGGPDVSGWRKSWFYHYNYEKQFPYTPNVRGVRTDQWKYVHYPHGDGRPDRHKAELYNIEFDPEERYNLIDRPKYAAVVKVLRGELASLMQQTGLTAETDKMPLDEGIKKELPDQKIR